MIDTENTNQLKHYLERSHKIVIIPHRNPDGDALGSSLGLQHTLEFIDKEVTIVSPNDFPAFLAWMPKAEQIVVFEREREKAETIINDADLIFTLDFNALHRTGDLMESFLKTVEKPFIMVDHHEMPDNYAVVTVSDTAYGSTCELLYRFLETADLTKNISIDAATCFYTGIVTDSGSFRFTKTTGDTHRVVAQLIDRGIDNPGIHNKLFSNSSYNRLLLLGRALEHLKVIPEHQTAYITLSQKDLYDFNFQKGDTEGIVNYGLSIMGIKFAAIFIENRDEGIIKISFRSEGNFDVNTFARKHFQGGGHINAAGGKSYSSLRDTVSRFVDILKKENILSE